MTKAIQIIAGQKYVHGLKFIILSGPIKQQDNKYKSLSFTITKHSANRVAYRNLEWNLSQHSVYSLDIQQQFA